MLEPFLGMLLNGLLAGVQDVIHSYEAFFHLKINKIFACFPTIFWHYVTLEN